MKLEVGKLYKRDSVHYFYSKKDDFYSKWADIKDRTVLLEPEQVFIVVSLGPKIDGDRQFYQILCGNRIGWIAWCDYWEGMKEVK